jgi:copper chaperone CopZ
MSNEQDTILEVEGMSCPSCIRQVTSALTELEGVGKVESGCARGSWSSNTTRRRRRSHS